MKINVKNIPDDGETLQGAAPSTIMDFADPVVTFDHDVEYRVHVQIQNNAVLVAGTLATPVTLHCSRCLKSFQHSITVKEFVVHRELQGEDFVDLTDNLREDIILELPQRALCQIDCQGLCPVCGKDLNEGVCQCNLSRGDLRWQTLDQIKLK